ncbi:ATP-binding protein [Shewanella sp. JM162201]|uniref:ATP-binding protein n=1 Tax=Shewanella jiangmenensis TaxID=2837387 RepID=A0ABS5V4D7_9GAMM|nr:ATP-binding protein [Shewanella jiangmenensis]MBT1445323.1 ATP-binding protein [Shewanella jiangmenensis]
MAFSLSVLLPSQEALLLRLQHLACYSQQLVVLLGEEGAGKSTLLTALVSEQEEYNAALVVCPMHADAPEIRRKILIQLLADPLFDDEEPLADTLARFRARQQKPVHILIDDAHHMPTVLWAECLLLSRQRIGGRPIAITLTSTPQHARELYQQLNATQRELMLPIEIEPLVQSEREALYYTLMSRTEDVPYVPRDIVKSQLESQHGLPGEVIALLEKALKPDTADAQSGKPLWQFGVAAAITLVVTAALWYLLQTHPSDEIDDKSPVFAATDKLAPFAKWRLEPYFAGRQAALKALEAELAEAKHNELVQEMADVAALAEARVLAGVETADTLAANAGSAKVQSAADKASKKADTKAAPAKTAAKTAAKPDAEVAISSALVSAPVWSERDVLAEGLPASGYTLQLATVGKRESADAVLKHYASESGLKLAGYKDKLVIFAGNYASQAEANAAAEAMSQRYGVAKPWVRAWKDLGRYKAIADVSGGEISN